MEKEMEEKNYKKLFIFISVSKVKDEFFFE